MQKVKRIISLLLVLVMLVGTFAGCGQEEEESSSKKKTHQSKEDDEKEKKPERTGDGKITVGIPYNTSSPDLNQNELIKYIAEKTGLQIEWILYPSSAGDYKTKIQTSVLDPKTVLPDVLLGFDGLGHYYINQLGEDRFLVDLKPYLTEEKAPNFMAAMSKLDPETQQFIWEKGTNTVDGKSFFALPAVTVATPDDQQSMIYINQKWLDAVGMQAPTTIQELEAVCKAFKEKDPNGNGQADEIPMLDPSDNPEVRHWIINAFVEYNSGAFNVDANGQVWDPVVTEEYRQALAKIAELTSKEYYDSTSFTASIADCKKYISPQNGEVQVGIFGGNMETMTNANTDALDEFVCLKPLKDATGKGGYNIINDVYIRWTAMITKDCVDVEEAMLFLDAWYEDEAVTRQRYGKKGEDWVESNGENVYGSGTSKIQVKNANAFFDKSLNRTPGNILYIMTPENYYPMADTEEIGSSNRQIQVTRLNKGQWANRYEGKHQVDTLEQLVYTQEEYEVREEKLGDLEDYILMSEIKFSRGTENVMDDAEWNAFKEQLENRARGEMMEIVQNAYNRKVAQK